MASSEDSDDTIKNEDRENEQFLKKKDDLNSFRNTFGVRHVLIFLGFAGFANIYAMRVNLSVAIVAMVNSTAIPQVNESDVCPEHVDATTNNEDGEFAWNEYTQGLILGAFFWGYMVTNIFGGRLAEHIGGKKVFLFGTLLTAVLSLLTPVTARHSVTALIVLRISMGLTEGVTFPAMNAMLGRWIPPLERSQASAIVYTGSLFGVFVSMPISGMLCQSEFFGGWPSVFYVFGISGIVWCLAWLIFSYDSPSEHPFISNQEKSYILQSLNMSATQPKALPIPYKRILTSLPVWAGLVSHFSHNWGFYFLLTEMPTYMKNVLHFDMKSNSFLSALPFFCMWLCGIGFGILADFLRSKQILSTTSTRRLFNSIGLYTPMLCLIWIGYAGCNSTLIIILLMVGVGINGAVYGGFINCHLDLASNYAGTLMGVTNFFATIPGFAAPYIVGVLINGEQTLTNWKIVFWIAASVYFVGNFFYIIFISGEEQDWNRLYIRD